MLKFLRMYQKWMLVIFSAVLMGAFLLQPVIGILYPDPGKRTVATVLDGVEIKQNDINRAQGDLQNLGRLNLMQQGIAPLGETEAEVALGWLLLVKAAENEGLIASQNEAFSLLASTQEGIDTVDDLDDFATEFGQPREYLLELARQYLVAEQYRQLVTGIEYRATEGLSASPGLARLQRMTSLFENQQQTQMQTLQDIMQLAGNNSQTVYQSYQAIWNHVQNFEVGGTPRVSAPLLAYATQRQFSQTSGLAVVLDSQPLRDALEADPQRMQTIFDEFKDVRPGVGQPFGFGYRIPDRAMLEAIRIPSDQVRQLAQAEIGPEQVREELNRNRQIYATWQPQREEPEADAEPEAGTTEPVEPVAPAEGEDAGADTPGQPDPNQGVPPQDQTPVEPEAAEAEGDETEGDETEGDAQATVPDALAAPGADTEPEVEAPAPLTTIDNDPAKMIQLREAIRRTLVEIRTQELVIEIARAVREELDAEARRLPEVAGYRQVPEDFTPLSLEDVADRVAQRFSTDDVKLVLTVIPAGDAWVTPEAVLEAQGLLRRRIEAMDKTRVLSTQYGTVNYDELPIGPLAGEVAPAEVPEDGSAPETDATDRPVTDRDGLLASVTGDVYGINNQQQRLNLIDYLATANSLRDPDNLNIPRTGLQKDLPSRLMIDAIGSAYVFRITATDPAHAPASMALVEDQLREDAIIAQAYDLLLDRKDSVLEQAKAENLYAIATDGVSVQTLQGFSMFNPPMIEGVGDVSPVLEQVADLVEALREKGQLIGASDADRTIAIELPREKKLVIFKLGDFQTLSQRRYESEARKQWVQALASLSALSDTAFTSLPVLTVDELKAQTGFAWADDYQPDEDDEAGASEDDGDE